MCETESARRPGSWWVIGCLIVMSIAGACSSDKDQSGGPQLIAGTFAAGAPGTAAGSPAIAGASGAPKPGMSAMTGLAGASAQTAGMPPSAAGTGASVGPGGFAGASGAPSAAGSGGQAGGAAQAGAGGAAGAMAGTAGSMATPGMGFTSVCAGGTMGKDSASAMTNSSVSEYAAVKYLVRSNSIVSLKTTMLVPKVPTSKQTLFIWPGLQCNGGKDPARIGNGILQPVLTWGGSCAPKIPQDVYKSWWMSAMYVNVSTAAAGPTGCAGGDYMDTAIGDLLQIDMSVKGTAWTQTIFDVQTMKKVDYTIDLKGQEQNWATWAIEVPRGESIVPADEQVFTDNVLTFASPVTTCQPSQRGPMDYFSTPILSTDKLNCCYDKIILRAKGTPGMGSM